MDPDQFGDRVQLCNRRPTYILTVAKKVVEVEIFASMPQQSDYARAWNQAQVHFVPGGPVLLDYGSESPVLSGVCSKTDSSSRNWDFGKSATTALMKTRSFGANFPDLATRSGLGLHRVRCPKSARTLLE